MMKRTRLKAKNRFDCVAMKRRGAARVARHIHGMTVSEEVAYWAQRTAVMKSRRRGLPRAEARGSRRTSRVGRDARTPRTSANL